MQEHLPLFILAFIWTIFATIQDLKTREVANWLNFSFIAFALAYRAFYASATSNLNFFLFGLFGLIVMVIFGNILYYAKAFAGGDAKLLMGYGIILPYQQFTHLFFLPIAAIFTLFLSGAIYSLLYSVLIITRNKKKFKKEFSKTTEKRKYLVITSTILSAVFIIAGFYNVMLFLAAILFSIPLVWAYTRTLEKCMIALTPPEKLTEGDWLEVEVTIGKKQIKKSVHGLSQEEIKLLRKHKKSVYIKSGIPFVPAFLITLIIMVSFFLASEQVLPFPFSLVF